MTKLLYIFIYTYILQKYTIPASVSDVSKTHKIVKIIDSEQFRANIAEEKHNKLERGHCMENIYIKPNINERDELQVCIIKIKIKKKK